MKARWARGGLGVILLLIVGADAPPGRVFPDGRVLMDEILARPYDAQVPMGCTGATVWATSPQGWAFRDDVHWLYLSNLNAFDLDVRDRAGRLAPTRATYHPSHIHYEGGVRSEGLSVSASYTLGIGAPLVRPFRPSQRWTCWGSGHREDWYALAFDNPRTLDRLAVWFFDDTPTGGCRPPERFAVERREGDRWVPVEVLARTPAEPAEGENVVRFAPIETDGLRLVFRNRGDDFYTGLYGYETTGGETPRAASALEIAADKFIAPEDVLVATLRIRNPTAAPAMVTVAPLLRGSYRFVDRFNADSPPPHKPGDPRATRRAFLRAEGSHRLHGQEVRSLFRFSVAEDGPTAALGEDATGEARGPGWSSGALGAAAGDPAHAYRLEPDGTLVVKAAMALHADRVDPAVLDRFVADAPADGPVRADRRDPVPAQVAAYQGWFDANLAAFDCSDPWVRKLYYHRAYNIRKNMLDPGLGRLAHPTQSEGRWQSGWYSNVISYGAGHQVREARWFRDPAYWQGHLRTWAENERPDGVYSAFITPAGPAPNRQYTDWITSTAWEGHLVHPDGPFLASVVDRLAANVRGWEATCDPDGDGLLQVDDHWWTGMEYQPSFFAASGFKVRPDFNEPAKVVTLDRVDLTAYQFGNAAAVARIYRTLGRPDRAREFEALAAKIAGAVRAKMWDGRAGFFFSTLRDGGARVDVKEVVGVYPFYFGMLPRGQGYEAAWASILDPAQFWTPWPVASCSKQCPAYSQSDWPGDGRSAACMWNGPTWPHANSIVLTAMARTLRADRDGAGPPSPLSRAKLWELFRSVTRAQFRDQDMTFPWTGEYYDGETARWKTPERDYNHSTYLDNLIPDLLGLNPRDDEVLDVDPLLPPDALAYFRLDGQRYRGHDVSIVWDAPGGEDRYGDGREGLDVYLDGRRVASAPGLDRLRVDMATGRPAGEGR